MYDLFFPQISYDLTGSLTRNKDSLPQNLLFTMKCKYPMNNTGMSTLWRQSTLDHKDALLFKPTAHRTTLCLSVVVFVCVCVSSHMQQTAPSVCILSIEGARCGVLWLEGHRQSLCGCQASLPSSSLIAIISMMRLIF